MRKMYHDLRFKEHLYIQEKKKKKRQKGKITTGSAKEAGSLLDWTVLQVTKVKHVESKEIAPNHITNKQQSWV